MSDFPAGEKIFKNLVEYPLPVTTGIRDYIFNFVPTGDPYGIESRKFFATYYKNHVAKDVTSLEAMIGILNSDVTGGGITQIREIVIVAHATAHKLFTQILIDISDPANAIYASVIPSSLLKLQTDFNANKFPDFNSNRKTVVAHLKANSWVTIRGCNFGKSDNGMYGLYSFFGGFANLYAPRVYQYFGNWPINWAKTADDKKEKYSAIQPRLSTTLRVHQHLSMQRFFPKDIHTPDRIDVVVTALVESGKFSDPFVLATKNVDDTTSTEAIAYDQIVAGLNTRTVSASLKQQFQAAEFPLTSPKVMGVRTDQWHIRDVLSHDSAQYAVDYLIEQDSPQLSSTTTLTTSARDIESISSSPSVILQMFFDEDDNKTFKGWLFQLTAYVEAPDPAANPDDKTKYDAVNQLLTNLQFSDGSSGGVNIKDLFTGAYTLTDTAVITLYSPPAETVKIVWLITDTTNYLVKVERGATPSDGAGHSISVYSMLTPAQQAAMEHDLISSPSFGINSDVPGTELMAYLDQYTLSQLLDFIDFLRESYAPENVIYIKHAAETIRRKSGFMAWYMNSVEWEDLQNNVLVNNGYAELGIREHDDMLTQYYTFDTNNCWSEVKSSQPTTTSIQQDLFTEEMLKFTDDTTGTDGLDPDSPSSNLDALRTVQSQNKPNLYAADKVVISIPSRTDLTCAQFTDLLNKIKAVGSTDPDTILAAIGDYKVEEEITFLDYATEDGGFPSLKLLWEMIENFEVYTESESVIAETLGGIAEWEGAFAVGLVGAIVEVFIIELKIANAEVDAAENWEREGKIVAIRQWAEAIQGLVLTQGYKFPVPITIDPNTGSVEAYYINRYRNEYQEYWHVPSPFPNIPNPDDLKKGFDDAWPEIERVGNEVLAKAGDILDTALKRAGLDACKINALHNSGFIDMDKTTNVMMVQFAKIVLDKCPAP
jgi:hypothetical protein